MHARVADAALRRQYLQSLVNLGRVANAIGATKAYCLVHTGLPEISEAARYFPGAIAND